MKTSQKGIAALKSSEGLRLKSYKCSSGVWTIGYGDTGQDVIEGLVITKEDAEQRFTNRLSKEFEEAANKLVKVTLNQNQFDAIISLMYNIGVYRFAESTLLKRINDGDFHGAANEFLLWNKKRTPNGLAIEPGLVKRREEEKKMFLSLE